MTSAPKSENSSPEEARPPNDGNQVVISGMSGLYPKSRYVRDLEKILYNKVNPITSDDLRWKSKHLDAVQFTGNVPDVDRFDAQFFKVHFRMGNSTEPMSRKMMELAYEAIYDAGINPKSLSGKKVGVYIGTSYSEAEKICFYYSATKSGLGIAGCNKAMFANRISYWLNAKGPSHSVDVACCSSAAALEQAYLAILRGECDAALAGSANLCLHPQCTIHYGRIMKLSKNGQTKSFDQDASGCITSEAVNMLFLQKAKNAFRIYAEVANIQCEFVKVLEGETGPKYGFYRDPEDTARFLKTFYERAGVPPSVVEYVEGFGSAVPDADISELEAFDMIFSNNRDGPLMIGSVMSNIGYTEAASGISAVTKLLIAYHRGELAGNLNCETPRRDVAAVSEGRIQVLQEHRPFRRTYAAVNCLSVTGVNAHVLLHGHYKPKDLNRYKSNIPHLVTISGRQESSVERAFDELKSQTIDPEQLALLQNIHQTSIHGHLGRGYVILDTVDGKTVSLSEQVNSFDEVHRPLWFVYSGMGSQWAGMAAQFMRFSVFAAAIERCHRALKPRGLDIVHIITTPDKTIFNNILHSFVGIAAVQIGLTDLLKELGLVPDKIIGHSVGELGCAYADGCLTAEEMILSAYSRGLVSLETPFIKGSMAAIGLGYQEALKLCPPSIEIACHNSAKSSTISGPADAVKTFVSELESKGIFAKEVPCSNIAYHSRYIVEAGPHLLKHLKEVIKMPKARSKKWVSTSVPQDQWNEEAAKYSSAEYHTNNLLGPVLFEETSRLIPSNAVLVEIAPHGLLQAILKRSLPKSCINVPLTRRGHPDSPLMLLEAVGKLYLDGFNPQLQVLYPKIEFPVSTGTSYLSPLVDWVHNEKWTLPLYASAQRVSGASCRRVVSIHDDEHSYLKGHVMRNRTQLPFSYALIAAWDTLAMTLNVPKKKLNVALSDIHLFEQPVLSEQNSITLVTSLHKGNGWFEVMDGNFKVATGYIKHFVDKLPIESNVQNIEAKDFSLNNRDVYQLFYERGYAYSGEFRSIHNVNDNLTEANVIWNENWVTFIDGLLQLNALKHPHTAVSQPNQIRKIKINVEEHVEHVVNKDGVAVLRAHLSDINNFTGCGGVSVENVRFRNLLPLKEMHLDLKTLKFIPRFGSNMDISTSLQIFMQIVAENRNKKVINVAGLAYQFKDKTVLNEMISSINTPGLKIVYLPITNNTKESFKNILKESDAIIVQNLLKNDEITKFLHRSSCDNIFIVNIGDSNTSLTIKTVAASAYKVVSAFTDEKTDSKFELICLQQPKPLTPSIMVVRSEDDLPRLKAARDQLSQNNLIILTTYPPLSGLRNLVKQWRKDSSGNHIHLVIVNDVQDIQQLIEFPDLAFNILDNGVWGGEYYVPLKEKLEHSDHTILRSEIIGNLESLKWVQASASTKPGISVKVHFAGLNTIDAQRASGIISSTSDDNIYGMEFSGVTESGERVMGLVPDGAARSHVVAQPEFMWPVPSHWTLEDAATVPLAYVYAYYCLHIKEIDIMKSSLSKVLIHGGTGALGQAMISICLSKGYQVFTTVSSIQKKKFLLKMFPNLKEENIGNSRDDSFGDMVFNATGRKGCQLVMCCLKGELKNISLKCSADFGVTFDTTQIQSNQDLFVFGMDYLSQERRYTSIDITSIFLKTNSEEIKRLQLLVCEGIVSGAVRPLSRVVFNPHEAQRAMRLLTASQHRGRVLLQLNPHRHTALPSLNCSWDGRHVIFCDAQPLGLQIADILINSGAKNIHLIVERPPSRLSYKQAAWKKQNVEVSIHSKDGNDFMSIFKEIESFGTIQGIYLATEDILKENSMLIAFDAVVRKACPSLKLFLMFSNGDDAAQFVSLKRAIDGLSATVLNVSLLERNHDEDGFIWYQDIKKAIERALLSKHPVNLAQIKHVPWKSLVQQIAELSDLTISELVDRKTTLQELGLQLDKSQAISILLRDEFNVAIDDVDVASLSLESIEKIDERCVVSTFEDVKGLGAFFSFVDPDELQATNEVVLKDTLASTAAMRDDEFDVSQTFLCVVPGLEGHHARFSALCERLKLPALALQPGLDLPHETVPQLATRYAQTLQKRADHKSAFCILGYEFGILVALELAAILEQDGQTGTVFCIGDGPEELKCLIKGQLLEYDSEEALQRGVVQHMFDLMAGTGAGPVPDAEGLTWRQRVDTCVRTLLGHVSHSAQYARALIEAAHARLVIALKNEASPKPLKSNIVLLRAQSPLSASNAPCSLQRYSQQPISVYNLTTPLAHVANDLRCASIINKHLSKAVLEAYETKNLCESYLLNADTFIHLTTL